jgi:uncharacterized peroxidase-related enzyme
MSRIPAIDLAQATGRTKDLLDNVQKSLGVVPNLFRVAAQSPAALEGLLSLSGALSHGRLSHRLGEQVALTVAERNGCNYCLSAHTLLGKKAGLTEADVTQARDARAVDAKAEAALSFAARVVDQAGHVSDAEIEAVRAAGFNDGEIVELVAATVLNIFTNTLNNVARTDIDFPAVPASARAAH